MQQECWQLMHFVLLLQLSCRECKQSLIAELNCLGEGLKIGALALFREGRKVTLETSRDRWFFTVDNHHSFQDTRVLTVIVAGIKWIILLSFVA